MSLLPCSAKGCAEDAVVELRWNNPKIHQPIRRKVWLACEQHQTTLGDYLGARQLLREVVPVGTPMPPGADVR